MQVHVDIMRIRVLALAAVLLALTPARSGAVTIEDLVALSKAGLAESVLVAVIDADRTVFDLTPQQVIELKNAGVAPGVIVKMLGTAREFAGQTVEPPPVVIVGDDPPAPPASFVSETTLVVPVYVPVPVRTDVHRHGPNHDGHRASRVPVDRGQAFVQPPPFVQPAPFVQPRPFVQPAPFVQPSISSSGRFINDGSLPGGGFGRFINDGFIPARTTR